MAETVVVESIGDQPLIAPASAEVEPGPDADEPDGEEPQVRKARKSPEMPSASEFKIQKITRIPYRTWCD